MTLSDPFVVLTVCTGNLHRSVLAERVLAAAADRRGLGWTVHSAGIAAAPGRPVDLRTQRVLERAGFAVPPGWTTHRVEPAALNAADLVLVAAEEHRRVIAELDPGALGRVYLLRQFARLAAAVRAAGAVATGGELMTAVGAARTQLQPVPPGADDVPDPVGRPNRVLRACLRDVRAAVEQIVSAVDPVDPVDPADPAAPR